jgi:hypothetical protein
MTTVRGLEPIIVQLDTLKFLNNGARLVFEQASTFAADKAQLYAPKYRGQLVGAIRTEVDEAQLPMWAKTGVLDHPYGTPIGSQAFAMEYGTGLKAEGENARGGRHFPPPKALDNWAKQHGLPNGFVAARAIWQAGGLEPRRYMRQAEEDARRELPAIIARAEHQIEQDWP